MEFLCILFLIYAYTAVSTGMERRYSVSGLMSTSPWPNNLTKLNPGGDKNFFDLLNLWHYSAAFTLDQYGHVVDSMKEASAERMQAFIDTLVNV